jgi:hypothetical protein
MALAGGAAAMADFRYERHWTVFAILDVLDGKVQYVVPVVPGEAGYGADQHAAGARSALPADLVTGAAGE